MCPRHLGAGAVIVRSFARIHESNLKKQGVLPLTFMNPADYDKVQERDRVSVRGLAGLAPDTPLEVVLHHVDGREDTIQVDHTLNEEQIGWFRAGSALNLLHEQSGQAQGSA
jgi:aconitate hydratase